MDLVCGVPSIVYCLPFFVVFAAAFAAMRRLVRAATPAAVAGAPRLAPWPCALAAAGRSKSQWAFLGNCRKMDQFYAVQWGRKSRLDVAAPRIAREWDADRNPSHLHPAILAASALEPYWWLCGDCGTGFCMSPEKRTLRGGACPTCVEAAAAATAVDAEPKKTAKGKTKGKVAAAKRAKGKTETGKPALLPGERNPALRATALATRVYEQHPLVRQ